MAFPTALKRPWRNRASLSARRASPARAASPPRENGDSGRASGLLGGEPSPERRDLNQPPVMGDAGGLMSSPVDVRRGSTRICGSAAASAAQPRRGAGPRCRGGVFALGPKDIERGWPADAPLRAPQWGRRGVGTLQRPHRGFRRRRVSRPGRRNVPDFHRLVLHRALLRPSLHECPRAHKRARASRDTMGPKTLISTDLNVDAIATSGSLVAAGASQLTGRLWSGAVLVCAFAIPRFPNRSPSPALPSPPETMV